MDPKLIERFFTKQCTAKEAGKIAAYLKANPDVLEKYASLHEWNLPAENKVLPEAFWNEVWQNIQKQNKAKIIFLRLKYAAAAASVILMAAAIYYFIPAKKTAPLAEHINMLPQTQRKTVINTTQKIITVVLQDGSVVKLSPASVIQYEVPFAVNKRNIGLEGEAKFFVAKNKNKPFTVVAGALATTALGTIFSVKKFAGQNNVIIKLFRGKVVVHSSNINLKGWNNDVYLQPGQQLKFNASAALLAVEKIKSNNLKTGIKNIKLYAKPDSAKMNQLIFSNTSLPQVMNRLSAYYNVTIKYDSVVIDTISFTGTISRTDSLPVILKAIGQMNDLDVEKSNNEFIISKPQHE